MADHYDFNQTMIDEFRANGGKLGGGFAGATMLLLHSTGAKTGKERVNPLAYQAIGDDFAVFASKGGAPTNPDWYYNLRAHPKVKVEVGNETIDVTAREAVGEERDRIWTEQKRRMSGFADYEERTTRTIPVIVLERA
jgi:deazaflavin-dependent oxidoreductase (nitroreductase family)